MPAPIQLEAFLPPLSMWAPKRRPCRDRATKYLFRSGLGRPGFSDGVRRSSGPPPVGLDRALNEPALSLTGYYYSLCSMRVVPRNEGSVDCDITPLICS